MCYKLVNNGSNSVLCKTENAISRYFNIPKSEVGTGTAHWLEIVERCINRTYAVDDFVRFAISKTYFIFKIISVPS